MKKFVVKEEQVNRKGLSKIPIAACIVGAILLLPTILLLMILFVGGSDTTSSMGIVLLKIIFFLVTIIVISFKRMRELVVSAFTQPAIITIGFLISSFFIVQKNFSMFTPQEGPGFKSALPFAILMWLLFPIIQSSWFIEKVPKWLLWIIRVPVWAVVFFTTMILLEISAMSIFEQLG